MPITVDLYNTYTQLTNKELSMQSIKRKYNKLGIFLNRKFTHM